MIVNSFEVRIEYIGPSLTDIGLNNLADEVDDALDDIQFSELLRQKLAENVEEVEMKYLKVTCDVE